MSDKRHAVIGSLKEIAVLVPLLGAAIAITYDVGFFWGLEISYFTLFSLTEHLVFALEALPIALVLSFFMAIGFAIAMESDQRDDEIAAQETASLDAQQKIDWYERRHARLRRKALIAGALSISWVVVAWHFDPLFSLIVFNFCVALYAITGFFYPRAFSSPFILSAYAATVLLLITFAVGIDVQERFVRRGTVAHGVSRENFTELTGRIVRAGERGLLFYEPATREISFLRWESVNRIRTVPKS